MFENVDDTLHDYSYNTKKFVSCITSLVVRKQGSGRLVNCYCHTVLNLFAPGAQSTCLVVLYGGMSVSSIVVGIGHPIMPGLILASTFRK